MCSHWPAAGALIVINLSQGLLKKKKTRWTKEKGRERLNFANIWLRAHSSHLFNHSCWYRNYVLCWRNTAPSVLGERFVREIPTVFLLLLPPPPPLLLLLLLLLILLLLILLLLRLPSFS